MPMVQFEKRSDQSQDMEVVREWGERPLVFWKENLQGGDVR